MRGMRHIALVCAALEPGRDGVGDYCRRLAVALHHQGVSASLLAIADRHVGAPTAPAADILRLPAAMPAADRHRLAAAALARWSPDWCSLQFVCWSHGWRGVVTAEAGRLRRLLAGRPLHIMFHEPWLTGDFEVTPSPARRWARAALGLAQKRGMARLARLLRPRIVHTSNAVYRRMLDQIGVAAGLLPIFGNIPLAPNIAWTDLRTLVHGRAGLVLPTARADVLLAGVFGAVRRVPVQPALQAVATAAGARRAVLLSLGDAGPRGREMLATWAHDVPGLHCALVGPLDPALLSACFDQLDLGVNLHPAQVIGRSGAAAALLEHGVPLISGWGQPPPDDDAFAARWRHLLLPADAQLACALAALPPRTRWADGAETAARQLRADLDAA